MVSEENKPSVEDYEAAAHVLADDMNHQLRFAIIDQRNHLDELGAHLFGTEETTDD